MRDVAVAPHRLIGRAVEAVLAQPDQEYSAVLVVMGNIRAAPRFKRLLVAEAEGRIAFLPEVVPWSQMIAHGEGEAGRVALVYAALKQSAQFDATPLWPLAREVLALVDEFTRAKVSLAPHSKALHAAFSRAFHGTQNAHLEFEAAVVHRVWAALNLNPSRPAPPEAEAIAVRERVRKHLAVAGAQVLFVDCPFSPLTQSALAEFADGITHVRPDASLWPSDADVARSRFAPLTPLVAKVCGSKLKAAHQLDIFSQQAAAAPGAMTFFAAQSMADEAAHARSVLHRWLDEGRERVALVSFDRKLARRLAAWLEGDGILVADEHGWPLPTTSAATPVLAWLDVQATGFHHRPLTTLFASPFSFVGVEQSDADSRHDALATLHRLAERTRWTRGLESLGRLAASAGSAALNHRVAALQLARSRYPNRPAPLALWFASHRQALTDLHIEPALAADAAGGMLLSHLAELERTFAGSDLLFSASEWQALYRDALATQRFVDASIESPIMLTTLSATCGRSFDGVLLLGASEANFIGSFRGTSLMSEAVRQQLRLASQRDNRDRALIELLALLATSPRIHASWQGAHAREPGALAAWLVPLLQDGAAPAAPPAFADTPSAGCAPLPPPNPHTPVDLVPQKLAVSAWQSLLDCPYQFFATRVLGLKETQSMSEDIDAGELGDAAHALLEALHKQFPLFTDHMESDIVSAIHRLAEKFYAPLAEIDYRARGHWLRWHDTAPRYVAWQRAREADGWRHLASESTAVQPLPARDGARQMALFGRMDRVDRRLAGDAASPEYAVLDYKTARADNLKRAAGDLPNVLQLPAYAALLSNADVDSATDRQVSEAAYVALPRDSSLPPITIPLASAPQAAGADTLQRLAEWAAALAEGVALPAHGDLIACTYCKVRGLCRRDWHAETPAEAWAVDGLAPRV